MKVIFPKDNKPNYLPDLLKFKNAKDEEITLKKIPNKGRVSPRKIA